MSISRPIRRREDERLLTGRGTFADDVNLPGQAYAAFVRSSHGHGIIRGMDLAAAAAAPGVLGIYTGQDLLAAGIGPIPYIPPPGVSLAVSVDAPRLALARDRVRHVGEPVVLIVAETPAQAADAAELVVLDIDPLPAVTDIEAAIEPGAPVLWEAAPDNVAFTWHGGDHAATEAAFARAAHITRLKLVNNRVSASPIEPRTSIASYDASAERFELVAATQGVHFFLRVLCGHTLKVPRERMHVRTYDVGGAFGSKEQPYPEDVAILHAARALGRPVKWRGTRAEMLLSDNQGRDAVMEGALALDAEGNFLAVRASLLDGMGAYYAVHGPFTSIRNTTNGLPLVYRTPHIDVSVRLVLTNAAAKGPYRGAGREQASYLMERLVEQAAREMGVDPVALRRRNFIPPSAMPYRTPAGRIYDSGEFEAVLDKALAQADWDGFAGREAASRAAGRLRGRGLCCFLEGVGSVPYESTDIRFADGRVILVVATQSSGQGHETAFPQLVAQRLGVPMEAVELRQGDSRDVPRGLASIGSRSMIMAGSAIKLACDAVIEKGRKVAAHLLEVAEVDVEFGDGAFGVVGTDRRITLIDLARQMGAATPLPPELPQSLDSTGDFDAEELSYPNGCHVCEVEVDPETGVVRVDRYACVDDVGVAINPMIVHGQLHGGIAQGLGQALLERIVYDGHGQLLTGSLMDYALPRAGDVPSIAVGMHEVPARSNPLGVKGAGEAGVTGSLAAIMNALADALARHGVSAVIDMPATPEKVWRALHGTG
jgi:carbon-monoxide dehydrogenase large subunit